MLDTNICIYVMTGRSSSAANQFASNEGRIAISAICLAELHFGVHKSSQRRSNSEGLSTFMSRLLVMPFSSSAAAHFGELRALLRRNGAPIGPMDLLIAAHARAENLTFVTNNRREFDRVPGLKVENWV